MAVRSMATRDRAGTVLEAKKAKVKAPPMFKVLLLNDDYTPMEFVVHVLERFFNKSREAATEIMLHVHHRGVGVCGERSAHGPDQRHRLGHRHGRGL